MSKEINFSEIRNDNEVSKKLKKSKSLWKELEKRHEIYIYIYIYIKLEIECAYIMRVR